MPTLVDPLVGLRVLVVEDEILIAEELRERLRRLGLDPIQIVDSGEAAIAAAKQHDPQLILMDIRLKGKLDGIEAARQIHERAPIPVVFLTAHSDRDTVRRAVGVDPHGYVLKPFNESELIVSIEVSLHRHKLEMRLKESEQRYASTLNSIGDGVIATDVQGHVNYMNQVAEALTQWRQGQAIGRPIEEIFSTVDEGSRRPASNPIRQALNERRRIEHMDPMLLISREGEMLPIDDCATPILSDYGQVIGAVAAFRDIRERRLHEDALQRAQEQLRHVQRMESVGRLASGIAHDFNNLLTVINGFTELLLQGGDVDENTRQLLGEIRKAGLRGSSLTGQLLAFSRKQFLNLASVELGQLMVDLSRMLRRLIGEDIELRVSSNPQLWTIRADAAHLEQVVMNLAVNARDAMPDGGVLSIHCANVHIEQSRLQGREELLPGRYVELSVGDTGSGMSEETQQHLFEPYYTTKERGKGTGLGLATVFGIVKQLGGFLDFESRLGTGTTFRLYFPAEPARARTADKQVNEQPSIARGEETLLLVEDEAAVRSLFSKALRQKGYTVLDAQSAEQARLHFEQHGEQIRLLITDVVMPGMNGRELAEQLLQRQPTLRVLYMSGYADDDVLRRGLRAGEVDFLQKPFTPAALEAAVRELLDR